MSHLANVEPARHRLCSSTPWAPCCLLLEYHSSGNLSPFHSTHWYTQLLAQALVLVTRLPEGGGLSVLAMSANVTNQLLLSQQATTVEELLSAHTANARAVHLVPFTSGLEIFEIGYWTDDRKCGVGD